MDVLPVQPTNNTKNNIFFSVLHQSQKRPKEINEELATFIQTKYPHQPGLIFCLSRQDCETISSQFASLGLSVTYYHASLPRALREERHQSWEEGEVDIFVVTQAFAMVPATKVDVRFVIHSSLPTSLERYYQGTNRAGLDGKKADCLLVYRYHDFKRALFLVSHLGGDSEKKEKEELFRVLRYCENLVECRAVLRREFMKEKGVDEGGREEPDEEEKQKEEEQEDENRVCCDNCSQLEIYEFRDVLEEGKSMMQMMITLNLCDDRGRRGLGVVAKRWREGVGEHWGFTNTEAVRLARYLVIEGFIEENVGNQQLQTSQSKYHEFVSSQTTLLIPFKRVVNTKRARR